MLELGGCQSQGNPTQPNQIKDQRWSNFWELELLEIAQKITPNKLFYGKERLKELGKKTYLKKKVKYFMLRNRVIFNFSVVSFMTWDKELNGETTIFSDFG